MKIQKIDNEHFVQIDKKNTLYYNEKTDSFKLLRGDKEFELNEKKLKANHIDLSKLKQFVNKIKEYKNESK